MKHLVRPKPRKIPAGNPYWKGFFAGLKPDPVLTVDQWADAHRLLSQKSAAEPGPWRTERTPYLREIMRELSSSSHTEEIVLMKGAQVGGSECGINWLGYIIDHVPGPAMAVQPTVDLAKRFSRQRVASLIEETPSVRAKVKDSKDKESGDNMLLKNFPGGILLLTGANSAVGLRSMPARYLFRDEIDAYPQNVDEEGSPLSLSEARTRTFKRNRKIFDVSTPTVQGRSHIETKYEASDKRRYEVPCPYCDHFQPLEWKQIRWVDQDPQTAVYICSGCEKEIEERWKPQMLSRGVWVKQNPESKVAGFHLSSLYSPYGWYSWRDAVSDWLKAQGKADQLKTFVNTVLGETWVEKGDAPDWRRLYERREVYPTNEIPKRALLLTGGVDVQKDRLEAQIVAWGKGKESWVIDNRVFPGDTSDLSPTGPWEGVREMMRESWTREGEEATVRMGLRLVAIDSGYNTQTVYAFVRGYPPNRVIATKGQESLQMLVGSPSSVDVVISGKRVRRGLRLWPIGVNMAKSELYGVLRLEKPTEEELALHGYPPGYVHFPELDEGYFKQLTAEQLVKKLVKGFTHYEWVKVFERNEALDTFILARVAASIVGIDRFNEAAWANLVQTSQTIPTKLEQNEEQTAQNSRQTPQNPAQGNVQRKKSTFW